MTNVEFNQVVGLGWYNVAPSALGSSCRPERSLVVRVTNLGASRMVDMGAEFPHVKEWRDKIGQRPAADRDLKLGRELRDAR